MFTIDTSVFVNGYDSNEAGNDISRALLDAVRDQQVALVLPELLVVEVAGALARTRGDIAAAESFAQSLQTVSHSYLSLSTARWLLKR